MKNNKSQNTGNNVPDFTGTDHRVRQEKYVSKKTMVHTPVKNSEQFRIVRRYSYNNNGGGYAGL
jgi:hypothetical protein